MTDSHRHRTTDDPLFHVALPDDWATAFADGQYRMSTRGLTLDDVGFIHCATRAQVAGVADRFYADIDDVVLLTIDPDRVPSPIVFEPPAPDVEERFPHIYGPLPVAAVVLTRYWHRSSTGWVLDP